MIPTIKIDVMRPVGRDSERFISTMKYPHAPCFTLNLEDLWLFIVEKRPTLKGQKFNVYLDGNNHPIKFRPK